MISIQECISVDEYLQPKTGPLVISLYNAGGAIAAFVVFQYLWLSSLSRNPHVHRALIFICASIAIYMFASAQVLSSTSIDRVQVLLSWQNLGIFAYIAGFFWLGAYLAGQAEARGVRRFLIGITLFIAVLTAISFSMPWGFLLDSVTIAGSAVLFNETITTFNYQASSRAVLVFALVYLMVGWGLWCSYRTYKNQRPYIAALLLLFTLTVAVLHTGNTLYQLDLISVNTPRGLTPFMLFVVVALLFGNEQRELVRELHWRQDQLREEVNRRRDAENTAMQRAYTDELTGLPNRFKLIEVLQQQLDAGVEDMKLILIHINRLRWVKQTFGEDNSDNFIREFARRLTANAEYHLLDARISETVFAGLTRETRNLAIDRSTGSGHWRDTRPLEEPYLIGYQQFSPTFSLSVIDIMPNDTPQSALHKADLALEASQAIKQRFSVVYYNKELADRVAEQHKLEGDLRSAIKNRELMLYFQPKVDREGQSVGAEALLRWQHPERGIVAPNVFVPLAERSGLMGTIGDWVIDACCQHLQNWQQDGARPGRLSINISAWQLQNERFAEAVLATLAHHKVPAEAIILELTESALVENLEQTGEQLARLREAGVHIALDDFGTGFSSLAYLASLPLDELKVDKTFIDKLADAKGSQLLHGLLDIGNALGLEVVAEGIETQEQFEALLAMGFEYFQGFLFSRPLPEDDFLHWKPAALAS